MELRVCYPETDPMGVVYHANFFIYFEMARVEHRKADEKLLAEGATTLACLNADFNPKPMPEQVLAMFRGKGTS